MSEHEPTKDTEAEEEAEEEIGEAFFKSGGPDREQMASDYIPEGDDWLAKTILDVNDPAAIAALSNLGTIYPEVGDLQPFVDDVLDNFLRGKTSVKGRSRDEYEKILMAMFGSSADDEGESRALQLVAADE
jgi:hypothetical protein